jgi:hypothetical protein
MMTKAAGKNDKERSSILDNCYLHLTEKQPTLL